MCALVKLQRDHSSRRTRVRPSARWRFHVAFIAVLLVSLAPAVGWAHATLLRSAPGNGAHVSSPPTELRLTFSEAPELTFSEVTLVDASGATVSLARPAIAPESRRTLLVPIRGTVSAGVYRVRWQVAGADGHPIRGEYVFTVAGTAPNAGAHHEPIMFPEGARGFGAESPAYVGVRWLQFLATLIVLGALCFTSLIVRHAGSAHVHLTTYLDAANRQAGTVGNAAAMALAFLVVLRLGAQSFALHGPDGLRDVSLLRGIVLHTQWGLGWGLQVIAVALLLWGFRNGVRSASWTVACIGGGVLALSLSMSGHALAVPIRPTIAVLSDALHVLASGAWLGSLLMVLAVGVPTARHQLGSDWTLAVAALVRALHPVALGAVSLLALTGTYAAWSHVGSVGALWHSGYGRTLTLKLALVCTALAVGGYNALRVRPRLVNNAGVQRFQRAASVELALAAVILLITAVLVASPTAMDVGAMQAP